MLAIKTRLVKDKTLKKGMPASSKFLTVDEYKKVYPERNERRSKDYMFDQGMSLVVPEKEAFALVKKYKELVLFDEGNKEIETKDDLDEMEWKEFRILAARHEVPTRMRKRLDITTDLRKKIDSGHEPITEEEYLKRKEDGKITKKQQRGVVYGYMEIG